MPANRGSGRSRWMIKLGSRGRALGMPPPPQKRNSPARMLTRSPAQDGSHGQYPRQAQHSPSTRVTDGTAPVRLVARRTCAGAPRYSFKCTVK